MNEKIHELAVAAGWNSNQYMPPGEAFEYFDLNQFAEKIIRECASVCYEHSFNAGDVDTPMGFAYSECGDDIKRSFGVE